MKEIIMLVSVVLIVGLVFTAGGCSHRHGHWGHHGFNEKKADHVVKKITKKLDLNEEQQKLLNDIKVEILAKRGEFKGGKKDLMNEFASQVKKGEVDQASINALFEKKEVHMKEMRSLAVARFAEFHKSLNPEQKAKLAEWVDKKNQKCQKWCDR